MYVVPVKVRQGIVSSEVDRWLCELPNVGAGNRTHVFRKRGKQLTTELSIQPCFFCLIFFFFEWVCACALWQSEDHLWELALSYDTDPGISSFLRYGSWDGTQVLRLGRKHHYLLGHFHNPCFRVRDRFFFFFFFFGDRVSLYSTGCPGTHWR